MLILNNKKRLIIISALSLVVIILGLILLFSSRTSQPVEPSQVTVPLANTPEFLDKTEKAKLGISPDLKVQALKREADGQLSVYKIINQASDIVADPSKIGPLSPLNPPSSASTK